MATEIFVGFRSASAAIAFDVLDTQYGVSIGARGYAINVLRDFDERRSDIQANWGNGWQLVLTGDFDDRLSTEKFGLIGFGRLGRAYISAGVGVGDDGIPQGGVELETADFGLAVDFVDDAGTRVFAYDITVGKFTYLWESIVVPANIELPVILGAQPTTLFPALLPNEALDGADEHGDFGYEPETFQ
eukprot:GHVN01024747.1.p3 GENE.GHVN01024747.1~~GHVN01024747.1.p3  ORF type:complete len:188 (-),score=24.20 GHVN01024747.1:796-1359(-)